jgi:hypothetical protein
LKARDVTSKRPLAAPADVLVDVVFKAEAVRRTTFELGFERGATGVLVIPCATRREPSLRVLLIEDSALLAARLIELVDATAQSLAQQALKPKGGLREVRAPGEIAYEARIEAGALTCGPASLRIKLGQWPRSISSA